MFEDMLMDGGGGWLSVGGGGGGVEQAPLEVVLSNNENPGMYPTSRAVQIRKQITRTRCVTWALHNVPRRAVRYNNDLKITRSFSRRVMADPRSVLIHELCPSAQAFALIIPYEQLTAPQGRADQEHGPGGDALT